MKASSALGTRFGACMLLLGCLPAFGQAAAGAAPARWTGFDDDPFTLSAGDVSASGSAEWSRGGDPRDVRGSVTGSVDSGCAQIKVAWLNSGSSTIAGKSGRACGGFAYSFVSPALECVRVTLVAEGATDSKVLCAGGS